MAVSTTFKMERQSPTIQNEWESEQLLEVNTVTSRRKQHLSAIFFSLHAFFLLLSFGLFLLSSRQFTEQRARNYTTMPFSDEFFDGMSPSRREANNFIGLSSTLNLGADSLRNIRVESTRLDGEFEVESVFKGRPREELDTAWDRISMGAK
jgi:hypothetical protein